MCWVEPAAKPFLVCQDSWKIIYDLSKAYTRGGRPLSGGKAQLTGQGQKCNLFKGVISRRWGYTPPATQAMAFC